MMTSRGRHALRNAVASPSVAQSKNRPKDRVLDRTAEEDAPEEMSCSKRMSVRKKRCRLEQGPSVTLPTHSALGWEVEMAPLSLIVLIVQLD